jgi:hypothetical protein
VKSTNTHTFSKCKSTLKCSRGEPSEAGRVQGNAVLKPQVNAISAIAKNVHTRSVDYTKVQNYLSVIVAEDAAHNIYDYTCTLLAHMSDT